VGADRLLALALVFAPISLVSLGGGPSVFAEMQRQSVEVHGWLSQERFLDLFAVSRAAPGPGSLVAALVGWEAAGFAGALVAALSLYLPSSLLLLAVGHWWRRGGGDAPLRRAVERGLAPVAVGLIFAGVVTLARGDGSGWLGVLTIAACAGALLRGASPYVVMLAAALTHVGLRGALG
jgi:chromate transporter